MKDNEVSYFLEDRKNGRLIRESDGLLEWFDFASKKWTVDFDLARIYFGGIECDPITEKEVFEMIGNLN